METKVTFSVGANVLGEQFTSKEALAGSSHLVKHYRVPAGGELALQLPVRSDDIEGLYLAARDEEHPLEPALGFAWRRGCGAPFPLEHDGIDVLNPHDVDVDVTLVLLLK